MRKFIGFLKGLTGPGELRDPPLARHLFTDPAFSWIWLLVRVYLGYVWIQAGLHKLADPKWMVTGEALKGYWQRAAAIPAPPGRPQITYGWYRDFIEFLLSGGHYTWFAKLMAVGEVAVGIALLVGLFVGIAAFFGAFMNWNFLMAGTASTNPMLFTLGIMLILGWKTAGWIGLDRWVLPIFGTPWQPGRLFRWGNGGGPTPKPPRQMSDGANVV